MKQTRRHFIAQVAGVIATAMAPGVTSFTNAAVDQNETESGDGGLIWYSKEYVTAETVVSRLTSWITPTQDFFIRNNLLIPAISSNQTSLGRYRLRVSGEVERPFELTFAELQQLRLVDVTNTLECAGNGRAFFQPKIG